MPLRIVFMGTAELACASLEALAAENDFQIAAVVTQPDRPRGRELKLKPPPVKEAALRLRTQAPVLQPERARNETFVGDLRAIAPDLIVVAAYGQILPQSILDLPRFGCINVHTSLLPRHRGAAPIQWAILENDAETGVTIMQMDAGLDTGAILSQERTPILPEDDAQSLHDRLARLGAALLVRTAREYAAGALTPRPQPADGATYARKLSREDGRLDWTQPARVLWNRVRAFAPWPGAFTYLPAVAGPRLIKILRAEEAAGSGRPGEILEAGKGGIVAACGQGALRILELQLEGGRKMTARDFLMGHPIEPGSVFSATAA